MHLAVVIELIAFFGGPRALLQKMIEHYLPNFGLQTHDHTDTNLHNSPVTLSTTLLFFSLAALQIDVLFAFMLHDFFSCVFLCFLPRVSNIKEAEKQRRKKNV